jgi:hypothetical protein
MNISHDFHLNDTATCSVAMANLWPPMILNVATVEIYWKVFTQRGTYTSMLQTEKNNIDQAHWCSAANHWQ